MKAVNVAMPNRYIQPTFRPVVSGGTGCTRKGEINFQIPVLSLNQSQAVVRIRNAIASGDLNDSDRAA
jgi:hypothetical protein